MIRESEQLDGDKVLGSSFSVDSANYNPQVSFFRFQ